LPVATKKKKKLKKKKQHQFNQQLQQIYVNALLRIELAHLCKCAPVKIKEPKWGKKGEVNVLM
jgi:hypothetical protein